MEKLSLVDWVAVALLVVGGLNWGLVGLLDFNLVTTIFGFGSVLTKAVYQLKDHFKSSSILLFYHFSKILLQT